MYIRNHLYICNFMPRVSKRRKISSAEKAKPLKQALQAPKGVHDIFPPEVFYFEKLEDCCRELADFYGYKRIEIPVIEPKVLFEQSVGVGTDIVDKEMYTLQTKGGDWLALRPEGTAGVVRAYIQNSMFNWPQPVKLWYWGPMFRYENPQAGRYRQFWQAGFEYLGSDNPVVDAEVISLALKITKKFGIKDIYVEINSIGCPECRQTYKRALKQYYRSKLRKVCLDCRQRYKKNPLRLLDCKSEPCLSFKKQAPEILDYLCKDCNAHFKKVLGYLDNLSIPYLLNPYLVRGLDYYSRTVFELKTAMKKSGQENIFEDKESFVSFVGGGRYDYLIKLLAGPDTPACGFATGVERMVDLVRKEEEKNPEVDIYLVQIGDLARVKLLQLLDDFKKSKIKVGFDLGRDSLKAQLKSADRLGARYTLILGQEEALHNKIIIRDMKTGIQETAPTEKLVEVIKKQLKL